MENTTALDANALLGWPNTRARELFHGTTEEAKLLYRRLVHRWHPDHSRDPKAHEVFIHLQSLYLAAGLAPTPSREVVFHDDKGRAFRFQFRAEHAFELGSWYRGKSSIAFAVKAAHQDLYQAFVGHVQGLPFASMDMRTQIAPNLPSIHSNHWGATGGFLVVRKNPEFILLSDLVAGMTARGMRLDPRHVGWILNGLHNIACYLSYARIAHQAITPQTVWVDPARHSVHLLGGWFHSLPFGSSIHALPAEIARIAPKSVLNGKTAGHRLDLESIRAIGRSLLGDASGHRLHPDTPSSLVSMLRLPASGTAIEEYQRWKQALQASFGAPKFVPLELSHNEIYPGE